MLSTGEVDYTFNGGHVGFHREEGATTNIQWDDFICGYDADADGTIGTSITAGGVQGCGARLSLMRCSPARAAWLVGSMRKTC